MNIVRANKIRLVGRTDVSRKRKPWLFGVLNVLPDKARVIFSYEFDFGQADSVQCISDFLTVEYKVEQPGSENHSWPAFYTPYRYNGQAIDQNGLKAKLKIAWAALIRSMTTIGDFEQVDEKRIFDEIDNCELTFEEQDGEARKVVFEHVYLADGNERILWDQLRESFVLYYKALETQAIILNETEVVEASWQIVSFKNYTLWDRATEIAFIIFVTIGIGYIGFVALAGVTVVIGMIVSFLIAFPTVPTIALITYISLRVKDKLDIADAAAKVSLESNALGAAEEITQKVISIVKTRYKNL